MTRGVLIRRSVAQRDSVSLPAQIIMRQLNLYSCFDFVFTCGRACGRAGVRACVRACGRAGGRDFLYPEM